MWNDQLWHSSKFLVNKRSPLLVSCFCLPSMLADHILPRQCPCVDILTQPTALDHSRSCLCLSVSQQAACWLLHDFVNSRACFSETGHCRKCLSILWFLPLHLTLFSSSQPSKVNKEELFVVGDDNDVTAGDIITVCQPGQQKRALLRLPSCLGNSSSWEKGVPKHWCIHLAFSLILPLYSHIQIFLCKLL